MIREAGSSSIKKNEVLPDKELKGLRLRAIIFGLFALIVFKYIELASDMGIIPRAHWGYVAPLIAAVGPVLMIVLVINPIVLKVFRRNVFDARDIVEDT
jgi:Na+/serine symporter